MDDERCVRIFFDKDQADFAKTILEEAGIYARISEDMFEDLKLPDLGMLPRFRLYIREQDIPRAGEFLAKKLKERIED